jgi:uncharacterized membrane protein
MVPAISMRTLGLKPIRSGSHGDQNSKCWGQVLPFDITWLSLAAASNVKMQDLTPKLLTTAAIAWLALIVAAPLALARGRAPVVGVIAYQIGALICHQRPERSFHVAGIQMPVCARCFGLYVSGAAGLVAASLWRRRATPDRRLTLALAALPIALTVALEWIGAITTTNIERCLTGVPLGLVAGLVIVESLRRPLSHTADAL